VQRRLPASAIGPRDFRSLAMKTDLVVLSGCDSGLGLESAGEGMLGFHQSLMGAGARNVIATLWRVADRSARELMTGMYRRLGAGEISYRAALREAQLRLRRSSDQAAPYYWAAFELYSTCVHC
jgi:CHAT domain-containing protein